MSEPRPDSESQAVGQPPRAQAEEPPELQQPPRVLDREARLDATAEYLPKNAASLEGTSRGESHAELTRYDFLDPPRAPGELGWMSHYRVRRLLGEGGMGLVFHAEDTDLLRPVALKVIRPELAGAPQAAQRFMREARAMAAVKHDHIVTIYQVGQERGVPFLAMEYLQGISLHRWLDRGHQPSVDLVLRLGRETAAGLAAAHKRGLIHRDIKPANIWLEAPAGRVKILDFGLARSQGDDVQITQPGTTVGSPAYIAPEQACGDEVGACGDLFSLGCVLYQLCTGRLPFPGNTVLAVLNSLAKDTPVSPRDLNPAVPLSLDALIMRLLEKKPADRPASAVAVIEAIKGIERELLAERQRVELPPATPLPAAVGSRKPAPAGVAGEPRAPRPAEKRQTGRRAVWIAAAVAVLGMAVVATGVALLSRSARKNVAGRSAPITVLATAPSGAVPESSPHSTSPGPSSLPKTAVPLVEKKAKVGEASPREILAAAPHDATPDRSPPRRVVPEKPATQERPKQVSKPADWGDIIDPTGDCQVAVNVAMSRATILVPGTPHILSAELGVLNAPRILRDVSDDFDAGVTVAGVFHPTGKRTVKEYAPYHGAGILLWQDDGNYVRLETAADIQRGKVRPYVNFEYRKDGALTLSSGLKSGDGSSHLLLKRRGDVILAAFGPDGVRWTSFPPLTVKLNDRLKVGVTAINTATKPLNVELEAFEISEKPKAGNRSDDSTINPEPMKTDKRVP